MRQPSQIVKELGCYIDHLSMTSSKAARCSKNAIASELKVAFTGSVLLGLQRSDGQGAEAQPTVACRDRQLPALKRTGTRQELTYWLSKRPWQAAFPATMQSAITCLAGRELLA
jgi:hypothetical protein